MPSPRCSDPVAHDKLKRYEIFLTEREALYKTAETAATQYAKAIITLSGASLVLTLTFIKDISPSPIRPSIPLIIASFMCFGFSLLATTVSLLLAQYAFIKQVEVTRQELLDNGESAAKSKKLKNYYTTFLHVLNIAGLVAFTAGLVTCVLFVSMNMPRNRIAISGENKPAHFISIHNSTGGENGLQAGSPKSANPQDAATPDSRTASKATD